MSSLSNKTTKQSKIVHKKLIHSNQKKLKIKKNDIIEAEVREVIMLRIIAPFKQNTQSIY